MLLHIFVLYKKMKNSLNLVLLYYNNNNINNNINKPILCFSLDIFTKDWL